MITSYFQCCMTSIQNHITWLLVHEWGPSVCVTNNCREQYEILRGEEFISYIRQVYQPDCRYLTQEGKMNRLTAGLWGKGNANPVSPPLQRFDKDAKPWWGKHGMIIQSTATVVFWCFCSPRVRFNWIPQFKAKLPRQSCAPGQIQAICD